MTFLLENWNCQWSFTQKYFLCGCDWSEWVFQNGHDLPVRKTNIFRHHANYFLFSNEWLVKLNQPTQNIHVSSPGCMLPFSVCVHYEQTGANRLSVGNGLLLPLSVRECLLRSMRGCIHPAPCEVIGFDWGAIS
jgi:hypothetical protein